MENEKKKKDNTEKKGNEKSEDFSIPSSILKSKVISIKGQEYSPVLYKSPEPKPPIEVKIIKKTMFHEDGTFNKDLFFSLMGSDVRRKILGKLAKFPRYTSDLAIDLGVSKQAVKKHLNKLLDFGIIEEVPLEKLDQKIKFYQISNQAAIFAQIDLTPNYFSVHVENNPEDIIEGMQEMKHNPLKAITQSRSDFINYDELNYALKSLGQGLHESEKKIEDIENIRKKAIFEKAVLLNRIQVIINALVENDLEKEVIFSLFYDLKSTVKGISVMDIVNMLFLRNKKRAGQSEYKYDKPDQRMVDRGKELAKLLQLLIENFGFIRTEGRTLFFDFGNDEI